MIERDKVFVEFIARIIPVKQNFIGRIAMNAFDQTTHGKVTWKSLKTELLKFDKEILVEMIAMGNKNYWSNQSHWMVNVEKN